MGLFTELINLSKPGVYILKNSNNKSCYVCYSSNISTNLVRYLHLDNFEFELLEIVIDPKLLRMRCQYWIDYYSNLGYTVLSKRTSQLKLRIDVLRDFRLGYSDYALFYVKIVYTSYKSVIVGIFSSKSECDSFIARNYSNNQVYNIIKADNNLTREYFEIYG